MDLIDLENNLNSLVENINEETFIYDFLTIFGQPKSSITRLKLGGLNLSKNSNEVLWKKKIFFKSSGFEQLHNVIDDFSKSPDILKYSPRFIIVTDYNTFLALDTKTKDTLDILINEIPLHYDFFLPLTGIEKHSARKETIADVKAAVKMAKLYDEILKDNPISSKEEIHSLNVFLSRLLFCFYAEDTDIFTKSQFTKAISSHTSEDGSDLKDYLERLFDILNIRDRPSLPKYLDDFPYVNGGLFKDKHSIPTFTKHSRKAIIDSGSLNWSAINPDIFGSMIQAVVTPSHRGGLGMHYTSVPNIMKVLEPLFLTELYSEFEECKSQPVKLNKLLEKLSTIKIFDPACGSGNFLIIAYKELRLFEIRVLKRLEQLQSFVSGFEEKQLSLIPKAQLNLASAYQPPLFSRIQLSQFYGIELDDFAHEIAMLSLWLAEHQMNTKFKEILGQGTPTLPLKASGKIIRGNSVKIDWEEVCPKKENDLVYILGNPPYLGFRGWTSEQKEDMEFIFKDVGNVLRLDYIGCWFKKASDYIYNTNARFAFVSTSSITQGEQVSLIWPYIYSKNLEISFAYKPFDWDNNAKDKAGVTCVILGIQNRNSNKKKLFSNISYSTVDLIGPYLVPGNSTIVYQRTTPISKLPEMALGSSGIDGGFLMLSDLEKLNFIQSDSRSKKFIKKFLSGGDFLNSIDRFCIWIEDDQIEEAMQIELIADRINKCKQYRLGAGRDAQKAASVPHRFFYRKFKNSDCIIVPRTSSGRRNYLPCGFLSAGTIVSNQAFVIYDAETYIFAILSSRLHCLWMEITSGKMRQDYSYSVNLTFNTLPFPVINNAQKEELESHVYSILDEREKYSERTLAQLYNPDSMPVTLKKAHDDLDLAIERCYKSKPFLNDDERLNLLFKLYDKIIIENKIYA